MATMKERALGDILVDQGVISPLELDEALQRQRLTGDMLGRVLVNIGNALGTTQLLYFLAFGLGRTDVVNDLFTLTIVYMIFFVASKVRASLAPYCPRSPDRMMTTSPTRSGLGM